MNFLEKGLHNMAKADEKILAIDIGAASLKICEFEYTPEGGQLITGYSFHEYEHLNEDGQPDIKELASELDTILRSSDFQAKKVVLGLSGAFAFYRFVKLPPIEDQDRLRQMVEYEVRQNIPFPIEEVTWDSQLFQRPESAEMETVLIMVRTELLESFIDVVERNGKEVLFADVSAVSTYNMARSNFIGEDQCEMIVDIGGHNTNLIFLDGQQFFIRSLPVSGYTITQQIAKEFEMTLEQAEKVKREYGFVNLGGNYAGTTSEFANKISKIIRNTMTRLHSEIIRSINLYRSAQQGNKPVKMYLTGGSSIMEYTTRFFGEKLDMEVEYLNPFQSVQFDESTVSAQYLEGVAHMFSSVVGLGMRCNVRCPVELKLIPQVQKLDIDFAKRKPWLALGAGLLVAAFGLSYAGHSVRLSKYQKNNQELMQMLRNVERDSSTIHGSIKEIEAIRADYVALKQPLQQRNVWGKVYNDLMELLPGYVWVDSIVPHYKEAKKVVSEDEETEESYGEETETESVIKESAHVDEMVEIDYFDVNLYLVVNDYDVVESKQYGKFLKFGALVDNLNTRKAEVSQKNPANLFAGWEEVAVKQHVLGNAKNIRCNTMKFFLKTPIKVPRYAVEAQTKEAKPSSQGPRNRGGFTF